MPLLSLGLLKDEREDLTCEGKGLGRDVSNSSRDGSLANHPASISKGADNGAAESRALPNHPLPSFDPAPSNGKAGEATHSTPSLQSIAQGRLRPYVSSSDPNDQVNQGTSHLP